MTSVGETLRRERLRRGFELEQISRELKISARFLEAIEEDDFKRLPGGVFAKSFVRQYARLLCLDDEELAGEVQRLMEPESIAPHAAEHPAVAEIHIPRVKDWETAGDRRFVWSSSLPALALVVVVMLLCSGVYAWWQRKAHQVSAHQQTTVTTQPAQVAEAQPPAPAPQPQSQEPTAPPPVAAPPSESEPVSAPAVQAPAVKPAQTDSADRPSPDAVAAPPGGNRPPVTPALDAAAIPAVQPPKGPVRLEVTADEAVWVLAQANGKFLFSGTLEPRQTRTVEANGTVVLRLGNAGGVSITLNGKPVGPVGPKGQVRTVQFTSGGFQIVAAPKPSFVDPLL